MPICRIAIGQCKLRPEPRIACLNLVLVLMLACASLVFGPAEGRSVPSLGARGFLPANQ